MKEETESTLFVKKKKCKEMKKRTKRMKERKNERSKRKLLLSILLVDLAQATDLFLFGTMIATKYS